MNKCSFMLVLMSSLIAGSLFSVEAPRGAVAPAVPLVRIFALPEKFDGKWVSTIGIVSVAHIDNGFEVRLYADMDHAKVRSYYDFVLVDVSAKSQLLEDRSLKEFDLRFVQVEGLFEDWSETESSISAPYRNVGALSDISRFRLLPNND